MKYITWTTRYNPVNSKYYVIGTDIYGNKFDSMYSFSDLNRAEQKANEFNNNDDNIRD